MSRPSRCPYCGYEALNAQEETAHMREFHPEVVYERLTKAGMMPPPSAECLCRPGETGYFACPVHGDGMQPNPPPKITAHEETYVREALTPTYADMPDALAEWGDQHPWQSETARDAFKAGLLAVVGAVKEEIRAVAKARAEAEAE